MLSEADLERPLIYVAGGIGITPLMAMLSHFVERVSLCEYGICPGTQALQTFPVKGWLTGTGCIDKGGLGQINKTGCGNCRYQACYRGKSRLLPNCYTQQAALPS